MPKNGAGASKCVGGQFNRAGPLWRRRCRSLQVCGWTVQVCTIPITENRCRSLQVCGWTVHMVNRGLAHQGAGASKCVGGQFIADVAVRSVVGAGASKCVGGQFSMESIWTAGQVPEPPSVWVDSSQSAAQCSDPGVPEPPSVGVDSSFLIGEVGGGRCRSLQVWGWTVPSDLAIAACAGCRSLQVWGWTVPTDESPSSPCGAGASKCGGGQFPRGILTQEERVPEPPSVGVDSSRRVCTRWYEWCRSLQVWGWTVHGWTKTGTRRWCRSLQVWGWTVHYCGEQLGTAGAGASKCGGGQFPVPGNARASGAGASKCVDGAS